jgi:sugar O-acyltransferase (sialic acid O-acetyltransferase NeuD family)
MTAALASLLIIGAGGHGRVVADTAEALGYRQIAFLDQTWPDRQRNLVWRIVEREIPDSRDAHIFVAIGNNAERMRIIENVQSKQLTLVTLVHPLAYVSRYATLGPGCYVAPQACVNVGSVVGRGVIVNTAAAIDHDCKVADGVHVSPGAHVAGGVFVGRQTWIGIGAVVREGIVIGADVMVGAGACVVTDVQDNVRVLGVPARQVF